MSRLLPKLRISPPTGLVIPGRGFYQLEENSLYVQIGPYSSNGRFFSYLESNHVRFDIDKDGHLLFIEIDAGRHTWKVDSALQFPQTALPADLHWLDFRSSIPDPAIQTNADRTLVHLAFPKSIPSQFLQIADSVIVEATSDGHLAGLFVNDIEDDLAGQEIARFRQQNRA